MQAVGQLHHHDANVVHHGQQHLADVFGLARFGSQQVQAVDFCDPFHERRDVRPKAFGDARVETRVSSTTSCSSAAHKRGDVQLHVRQDVRDFQRMRKVRVARLAQLRAVLLGGKIKRAAQKLDVARRARLPAFSTSSRKRACRARVVRSVLPPTPTSEDSPTGFSSEDMSLYFMSI